jgi:hypothetical protein
LAGEHNGTENLLQFAVIAAVAMAAIIDASSIPVIKILNLQSSQADWSEVSDLFFIHC